MSFLPIVQSFPIIITCTNGDLKIVYTNGDLKIVEVREGSAAANAGVFPGCRIVRIDDQPAILDLMRKTTAGTLVAVCFWFLISPFR